MLRALRTPVLLLAIVALVATFVAAQNNADAIFTISVTAPTMARDVQVRSFLTDESGASWSCREAGARLKLQVLNTNPAGRLYERLGFITTGGDQIYTHMEFKS